MANMSYCRFRNTVIDLQDCYDNLFSHDELGESDLDPEEAKARERLIKICRNIVADIDDSDEANQ